VTVLNKYMAKKTRIGPRNEIIATEESIKRAEDLIKRIPPESNNAFKVHSYPIEYWTPLRHGRLCSCNFSDEVQTHDIPEGSYLENRPFNLHEFIMTVPQLLPSRDDCPICLSTNFVGGFFKYGSDIITLDSTVEHELSNLSLEKSSPYFFCPTQDQGTITWDVHLPKYFSNCSLLVKWKGSPPDYYDIKINNEVPSKDLLFNNKNKTVTVTVTLSNITPHDTPIGLYCIFIILELSDNIIYANFPEITYSLDSESFHKSNDINGPQTVILDNVISKPSTLDVFIDIKHNLMWAVTEITPKIAYNEKIETALQCRLVRSFEDYLAVPSKLLPHNKCMIIF
jgi:hypothetical protein